MKTRKAIDYETEDTEIRKCTTVPEVEAHCHRVIKALRRIHQKELAPYLDLLVKIEARKSSPDLLPHTSDPL
jgi:hypothetical protein